MNSPAEDPVVLRSVLAAAYVLVAVLASRAARLAFSRERTAWLAIAATLVLLGAAKQLGVQGMLTAIVRSTVISAGWYSSHYKTQLVFALAVAVCGLAAGVVLARYLRECDLAVRVASGALLLLLGFAAMRVPSVHALDVWTTTLWAGMRRGWWIELLALAVICVAACSRR